MSDTVTTSSVPPEHSRAGGRRASAAPPSSAARDAAETAREVEPPLVAVQRAVWDRFADQYDEMSAAHEDQSELGFYLALSSPPARVLELGAGTGRVAVPLANAGHDVTAVDVSDRMLAGLSQKRPMRTVRADMTRLDLDGEQFDLVLCVCTSLSYLTSADLQRAALGAMRRHLAADGVAVIHTTSPSALVRQWGSGPSVVPSLVTDETTILMAAKVRTDLQELRISHMRQRGGVWSTHTLHERYVWPSELALMAELEGLRIRNLWGGWVRQPFDLRSDHLIAVLERDDQPQDQLDSPQEAST